MTLQRTRLLLSAIAVSAIVSVIATAAERPAFPLRIAASGRYFVDSNNRPFFINGDTPWSLTHNLTYEESVRYMEDRKARGFNTLLVSEPDAYAPDGKPSYPPDRYGQHPFLDDDMTRPNEPYWANVDRVFKKALELDFLLMVTPAYIGAGKDGYIDLLKKNGAAKCATYGRWIGQRYAIFPNIVWVHGGDRNPHEVPGEVRAIAKAIREVSPGQLHTAHWASNTQALERFKGEGWLDFNSSYTYGPVAWRILYDRATNPTKPTFLIETHYEDDFGKRTADDVRRYPYRAVLSGAAGHLFGNKPLWFCGHGWEKALGLPGSVYMTHVRTLFESRPWHELQPDVDHVFVVRGHGDFGDNDGVQAAATTGQDTLIVYMTDKHRVTIDLSKISGQKVRGFWYDTRTGKSTEAEKIDQKSFREFRTPGPGDWILVLDDAANNRPAPGSADR